MAINGIGGVGGASSAMAVLRLALRQTQAGPAAPGAVPEAPPEAAGATASTLPDAQLQNIVARAQFTASVRVAAAAVEQVDTVVKTYDQPPVETPDQG